MDFLPSTFPAYISVKVKTGKPKTEISGKLDDGTLKMDVKAIPEKGKANSEIQKFFKKSFGIRVTIKSGSTNSTKLLYLEKI